MQKKIARKIASITAVSLASGLITVPAGANADLTPNLQIMQKTEIISDEALCDLVDSTGDYTVYL